MEESNDVDKQNTQKTKKFKSSTATFPTLNSQNITQVDTNRMEVVNAVDKKFIFTKTQSYFVTMGKY